eukprot:1063532_1
MIVQAIKRIERASRITIHTSKRRQKTIHIDPNTPNASHFAYNPDRSAQIKINTKQIPQTHPNPVKRHYGHCPQPPSIHKSQSDRIDGSKPVDPEYTAYPLHTIPTSV